MSTSYVAPGNVIQCVAPSGGVVSGVLYTVGTASVHGVCMESAAAGASFPLMVEGVFELPKLSATSGQAFAAGAAVYTDGIGNVCVSSGGYKKIGTAYEAATSPATTLKVRLNPSF